MTDTEKKIAEVLDLSKPVSDCPECGGLGEIRSLGSRRKCECLYIRLKTLKRELDRRDEENRKLRKERDDAREQAQKYYRKFEDEVAEIFQLQDELQSAQQEIERLKQERDKLIEGLRWYADEIKYMNWPSELWINQGQRARDILREVGVTTDA